MMTTSETTNTMRLVTFQALPEEVAKFDEVAWNRHMNRSELLRELMQNTINKGA